MKSNGQIVCNNSRLSKLINPLTIYFAFLFINHFIGFCVSLFFLDNYTKTFAFLLLVIYLISSLFLVFGWTVVKSKFSGIKFARMKVYVFFLTILYVASSWYIFNRNPPALFFIFSNDANLHELRALATKGKSGLESVINAVYFFTSYVALPALVLNLFSTKSRWRYIVLLLTVLSLLLTLEKARTFIIFFPLAFFFAFNGGLKKMIIAFGFFFFLIFSISQFVGLDSDSLYVRNYSSEFNLRATGEEKMLFSAPNSLEYILNRIFWIPHITSIDWLKFKSVVLNGRFLWGQTTPVICNITSEGRYRIENEVFKYQFSAGEGSLGSANSHFAMDAFLNFGMLGVILYSFIVGIILKVLYTKLPSPINLVAFSYSYSFVNASLHSQILGGGILVYFIIIYLFKVEFVYGR